MVFCPNCGNEIADGQKFCPNCGKPISEVPTKKKSGFKARIKGWSKKKKIGVVVLIIIILFFGLIIFGSGSNEESSADSNIDNFFNLSEGDYKAKCTHIDFAKLDKNPDNYYGKTVKYTGNVLQIMDDGSGGSIRLATDGGYSDVIYVHYTGTNDVVEGDTITVYGYVVGSYTYQSQANYQITLPLIEARYIE